MIKTVLVLLISFSVFGQSLTFSNNGSLAIFPISPNARGADIFSMFTTLNTGHYKLSQSQIALQTTKNGLIPNIQFITPMKYNTILIIGYLLPPNNTLPLGNVGGGENPGTRYGYVCIPVEQIVEMIYSPTIMSTSSVFTSHAIGGTLPIFSVDLAQRTADIIQAVNHLISYPIAYLGSAVTPVSLQTTINGPYYLGATGGTPIISGGLIPQVASIVPVAPNNTLMLVTFKPYQTNTNLSSVGFASVVLSPDQITGIVFTQK